MSSAGCWPTGWRSVPGGGPGCPTGCRPGSTSTGARCGGSRRTRADELTSGVYDLAYDQAGRPGLWPGLLTESDDHDLSSDPDTRSRVAARVRPTGAGWHATSCSRSPAHGLAEAEHRRRPRPSVTPRRTWRAAGRGRRARRPRTTGGQPPRAAQRLGGARRRWRRSWGSGPPSSPPAPAKRAAAEAGLSPRRSPPGRPTTCCATPPPSSPWSSDSSALPRQPAPARGPRGRRHGPSGPDAPGR